MKPSPALGRATAAGFFALLIWSSSVAVIRALSESVGALTAAATAVTLGGAISVAYGWARGTSPLKMLGLPRAYLIGCGSTFVICNVSLYLAVGWSGNRSTTLVAGLVNYLWPALTVAFSVPILHRRARWTLVSGCLLAVAGSGVAMLGGGQFQWSQLAGGGWQQLAPLCLALAAAVSWGLYSNFAVRWGRPDAGAVPLFLLAGGGALWLLWLTGAEAGRWTVKAVLELAVLAVASLGLAYGLWDYGMRRGNSLALGLAAYFMPVASLAVACAYLGVWPGANLLVGCLLVAAGAWVCRRSIVPEPCPGTA